MPVAIWLIFVRSQRAPAPHDHVSEMSDTTPSLVLQMVFYQQLYHHAEVVCFADSCKHRAKCIFFIGKKYIVKSLT